MYQCVFVKDLFSSSMYMSYCLNGFASIKIHSKPFFRAKKLRLVYVQCARLLGEAEENNLNCLTMKREFLPVKVKC